jgi:hypothetical protein
MILTEYHVPNNFTEAFSHADVDTLRPLPGGNFPGIATDPDRSIELPPTTPDASKTNDADIDNGEMLGLRLDDILDEPPVSAELDRQAGDDWLEFEGHKYHKALLLRVIFSADFTRKSRERLERVRAYTAESLKTLSKPRR